MARFKVSKTRGLTYKSDRKGKSVLSCEARFKIAMIEAEDMLGSEQEAQDRLQKAICAKLGGYVHPNSVPVETLAVCAEKVSKSAFWNIVHVGDPVDPVRAPWLAHLATKDDPDDLG